MKTRRQDGPAVTKPENDYDYAGQDPINGYDLSGTVMSAMGIGDCEIGSCGNTFDTNPTGVASIGTIAGRLGVTGAASRLAKDARGAGRVAGMSAGAIAAAAHAATPYFYACAGGALMGSLGGAGSAAAGCVIGAIDEYAQHSSDERVRVFAATLDLAGAAGSYRDIRLAQGDPGRPFRLWRDFMRALFEIGWCCCQELACANYGGPGTTGQFPRSTGGTSIGSFSPLPQSVLS